MNPTLTQWLNDYHSARAQYEADQRHAEHLPYLRVPLSRPTEMQFTITTTGLLRDHAGARMGHVSEMSAEALASIEIDRASLTARQRRTPTPRRGATPTAVIMDEAAQCADLSPEMTAVLEGETLARILDMPEGATVTAINTTAYGGATTLPNPAETPTRYDEDHIPDDAAPGDIVTRRGERVGIVGRNGRNEVVVVRDPNPLHDRLRRPAAGIDLSTLPAPDLSRVHEGIAAAAANMSATMGMSLQAAADSIASAATSLQTPPAPFHEGPRMLADLSAETGSAERYAAYTATTDATLQRAGEIFNARSLYATTARRMADESPRASYVDRSAAQIGMFMARAYGVEFNDETLTAVTAMTTTFARQAAFRAMRRAEEAEAAARRDREARDRLALERDALRGAAPVTPGRFEQTRAAVQAAQEWKAAPLTDSVAKLAAFKHLLATLEELAG